jgi:hypothetical protein
MHKMEFTFLPSGLFFLANNKSNLFHDEFMKSIIIKIISKTIGGLI